MLAVGDSNERAPTVLVIFLRTAIVTQIERLQNPLPVNKELKLLSYVADFVSAYHGLMKQKTTPLPFPLVQMTRTFLFLWIFTLPFGLANDFDDIFPLVVIIFFTTYGFVGLEKENIVVYGCTNYRDEKSECGIIWNDPHLKIKWPVKKPLLSEKDINNKPFRFYFK